MRIVLQQVDLDTCLTGLLRGAATSDDVSVRRDGATPAELDDREVLCIEAGGSGRTDDNNFDHHDPGGSWPPACVQAFRTAGERGSGTLQRLVDYVADVDLGCGRRAGDDGQLDLSGLFSGLRLAVRDPQRQFFEGLAMLRTVLDSDIDPRGPLPARPEWTSYREAKERERALLEEAARTAERFTTRQGRPAGLLWTDRVGALGALYTLGCEVGIAFAPAFRPPAGGEPIRKFTVGGRDGLRVDGLLAPLSALEAGWGGPVHGTIIASPRGGTRLDPEAVRRLVCEHL